VDGIYLPQHKNQWQAVVNTIEKCVISGFCHKVAENCTVLGYYVA